MLSINNKEDIIDVKKILTESTNIKKIGVLIKKFSENKLISYDDIIKAKKILSIIKKKIIELNEGKIKDEITNWTLLQENSLNDLEVKTKENFGQELKNELSSVGLRLEGYLPLLKANPFLLDVEYEKNRGTLYFGFKDVKLCDLSIDPKTIKEKMSNILIDFRSTYSNKDDFMRDLLKAYKKTKKNSEKIVDKKVPIIEVLDEMAIIKQGEQFLIDPTRGNYKDYGRAQFSYDLFRFLKEENTPFVIHVFEAVRSQSRSKLDYLWIPKDGELNDGAIYSHIEIGEKQDG